MKSEIWAIIGGGQGGQTFAGHMAMLGKRVRLFTKSREKAEELNAKGEILLYGAVSGVGHIEFATSNMESALNGATHIVMILPSNWHEQAVRSMAPYLRDGQYVLILPEASCGALAFRKVLSDLRCNAKIVLAAGATLPYAVRVPEVGKCHIIGLKTGVKIAGLPASNNKKIEDAFCSAFNCFVMCKNVIETSLDNINLMVHPVPVLLNVSRIEADPQQTYEYYHDGFTPSVGTLLEKIDAERIAVGEALGCKQRSLREEFKAMYHTGADADTLCDVIRNNPGYKGIANCKSLRERYFMEDVPYSMESVSSLGKIAGVKTPCIDAVCTLAHAIVGDEMDKGRTIENLGLKGTSKGEFLKIING